MASNELPVVVTEDLSDDIVDRETVGTSSSDELSPSASLPASPNGSTSGRSAPPHACLFVAGLPTAVPEATLTQGLKELFERYGPLVEVKVLQDRAGCPYAFVQFESATHANTALKDRDRPQLMGRTVRVEKAHVNRTLFLARFPRTLTTEAFRAIVEAHGPIESTTICRYPETQRSKGCGFVKYASRIDAGQAFQKLRAAYPTWVIEWSMPNHENVPDDTDRYTVFVGGLDPENTTKELLQERFAPYGEISSVELVNKDKGMRSAFGFVRYATEDSIDVAIEAQDGTEWFGRRIRVQYCETEEVKARRKQSKAMPAAMAAVAAAAAAARPVPMPGMPYMTPIMLAPPGAPPMAAFPYQPPTAAATAQQSNGRARSPNESVPPPAPTVMFSYYPTMLPPGVTAAAAPPPPHAAAAAAAYGWAVPPIYAASGPGADAAGAYFYGAAPFHLPPPHYTAAAYQPVAAVDDKMQHLTRQLQATELN